ncbi:MAG: winged helix-turn-helix transcriptional regulator [Treponemataceae bacterium]|nr:winged helix-turn-helix transcriptional regulator [Treponemataceae bacterium]
MNAKYLEKFFRNLLLGESNELKNRYVHIRYNEKILKIALPNVTVNVTVKLTANQKNILGLVKENPDISQEAIASELGIARETVNRNMKKLQERNVLKRLGADKNGRWEIV